MASGLFPLGQLPLTKSYLRYDALATAQSFLSSFAFPIAIFWSCLRKIICDPIPQTLEFVWGAWTSYLGDSVTVPDGLLRLNPRALPQGQSEEPGH